MLERRSGTEPWETIGPPVSVSLGRNGLAWGTGEHHATAPAGFPLKREGDGCSPAGVFRLPYAFGYADEAPDLKLKYLHVTRTHAGVDDSNSKHYNQIVDAAVVARDWQSHETMLRPDGLYRWGAFVAHNPANVSGGGSCIFLHIWQGADKPTSGCTAMADTDLVRVLEWLDPAKEPRLVQTLPGW